MTTNSYKLGIVGSRTFTNYPLLESDVNDIIGAENIAEIISGGANGADSLAEEYAEKHNIPMKVYPAKWDQYGKRAGFIRNVKIVEDSDVVIAFWDGKSKGTKHTIDECTRLKKQVHVILYKELKCNHYEQNFGRKNIDLKKLMM